MSRQSLPTTLKKVLLHHIEQADIVEDEELKTIVKKLDSLNQQVEMLKEKALQNRLKKEKKSNVIDLDSRR